VILAGRAEAAAQIGVPIRPGRLVQQAIAQVLTPIFDPLFSGSSLGFRPGRPAPTRRCRRPGGCSQEGRVGADIDLDRFFDRVQFDVFMARVARRRQRRVVE
jgi:RNA-directed DNA polymerase